MIWPDLLNIIAAIIFILWILSLNLNANTIVCFNTSYGVTLIDKTWLLQQLPDQKIKEVSISLKVKRIDIL